jgi:hypothetical protein
MMSPFGDSPDAEDMRREDENDGDHSIVKVGSIPLEIFSTVKRGWIVEEEEDKLVDGRNQVRGGSRYSV